LSTRAASSPRKAASSPLNWTHLIIHHTATGPRETVATLRANHVEKRGFSDIGYHYVIERDWLGRGHLKRGRPDTRDGGHAGRVCDTFDGRDWNAFALGLAVVGNFEPGYGKPERMSPWLYRAVLAAAAHLCKKYGIPPEHVKYHREIKATACPGAWFPMARLRQDLARALGKS